MSDLISRVKELYAAFHRGDIAVITRDISEDATVEFEAHPEILASGIRRGRKQIMEYFQAMATEAQDQKPEMTEFFSNDDAVAAFGRTEVTMRATGIRVDSPLAHYFKFRDGKVVRFVILCNSAAFLEAVRGKVAAAASS